MFGVSTNDVNTPQDPGLETGSELDDPQLDGSPQGSDRDLGNLGKSERSIQSDEDIGLSDTESTSSQQSINSAKSGATKRTASNPAPKLIVNKRKHLERQLSAKQRDQLLLRESQEDSRFKKDIAEAIRQSNETFAESMKQMSESMKEMTRGLTSSFQVLTMAMFSPTAQPPAPVQQYQYPVM